MITESSELNPNKDLTNDLAMQIGMAAAEILTKNKNENKKPTV